MKSPPTSDDAGDWRRYVFVRRVRCPACKSPEVRFYRTSRSDDGEVVTRYTRCTKCGAKFLTVAD